MSTDPQTRIDAQLARVVLNETSAFLQEAADLSTDHGAPLSPCVAFYGAATAERVTG